jgi:hypothetical protein
MLPAANVIKKDITMKRIPYDEFIKRTIEVSKARKIFIESGLTKNISDAFFLYQEILAEEKMEVFVSTMVAGNRAMSPIDDYVRPQCPECNIDLRLILNPVDEFGKQWPTGWYCEKCLITFYQDKNVVELMQELEKK